MTALGETLQLLRSRGFTRTAAAHPQTRAFDGALRVSAGEVPVRLEIEDWDFLSYPRIALRGHPAFLPNPLPHLDASGAIATSRETLWSLIDFSRRGRSPCASLRPSHFSRSSSPTPNGDRPMCRMSSWRTGRAVPVLPSSATSSRTSPRLIAIPWICPPSGSVVPRSWSWGQARATRALASQRGVTRPCSSDRALHDLSQ